ncbi:carbohydrate ABC transporter permease [Isoptericola hypogeus]|uniref:Carbohydrate ABC transporter permease n=1 Tax=Isoptericola hypogeus TaxID=300179 RepID=A0ABN2JQB6_9MICO
MTTTLVPDRTTRPAPQSLRPDRSKHTRAGLVLRYTLLALMLVLLVGPFLWQLSTSLKGAGESIYSASPVPSQPTLDNYRTVAETIPVFRYVGNSLLVASASAVLNVVLGSMAGYALARLPFRGRAAADLTFLATIVIPFEVIMVSVFLTMRSIGLVDSLAGVVLPAAASGLSIVLMRTAFLGLPRETEEAAKLDGANAWQRYRHIAMPSVKGTLTVVAIFAFVFAWDDFLWPLVILKNPDNYTLTVGIQYLSGTFSANQRVIAAGTMIAVIPLLALFFSLQRWFFRGVGEGGIKG